ncbi:Mitotic spindle checkpoint component mad2 [Irineochytrium annulatum]|nr:Mitotic spindle checkpoint component mad2 [Irineochytrium annulatum]
MAQLQLRKKITLKGSAQLVAEFFDYSIQNILFQRALYPPEDFKMTRKYGLNILTTTDDTIQKYLRQILDQVEVWIRSKTISSIVLVISTRDTREVVERWQFNIELEPEEVVLRPADKNGKPSKPKPPKTEKEIHGEIAAIMRQITASVSFLPVLDEPCTFNILAYTDRDAEVPASWEDSDARMIQSNSEQVKLRSFSTSVHEISSLVDYKLGE